MGKGKRVIGNESRVTGKVTLRGNLDEVTGGARPATLFDQAAELEDREDDAHGDKADDATHEDDHHGFDHGGYAFDDGFKLTGVKLGNFVEDFAQLTGFFARADHLHDRTRQQGALIQRRGDLLTLLDGHVDRAPHALVDGVAGDLGGDAQGVEDGHARV